MIDCRSHWRRISSYRPSNSFANHSLSTLTHKFLCSTRSKNTTTMFYRGIAKIPKHRRGSLLPQPPRFHSESVASLYWGRMTQLWFRRGAKRQKTNTNNGQQQRETLILLQANVKISRVLSFGAACLQNVFSLFLPDKFSSCGTTDRFSSAMFRVDLFRRVTHSAKRVRVHNK